MPHQLLNSTFVMTNHFLQFLFVFDTSKVYFQSYYNFKYAVVAFRCGDAYNLGKHSLQVPEFRGQLFLRRNSGGFWAIPAT